MQDDDGNLFKPHRPVPPSKRLPTYRVSAQRPDGLEVTFEAASTAIAVHVANDFQGDGYTNITVKWPDKASPDSEDGHTEWRRHRRRSSDDA